MSYYDEDTEDESEIDSDEIEEQYHEQQDKNRAREAKIVELERQKGILSLKIGDLEDKIEEFRNPEGRRATFFGMPGTFLFTKRGGVSHMTKL